MTRDEVDTMWQQAMQESIKDGEMFTRYHFAKLVAEAEREACVKVCEEYDGEYDIHPKQTAEGIALQILARGQA
jgi:hypothetical protein